jgi:hypothetical protein
MYARTLPDYINFRPQGEIIAMIATMKNEGTDSEEGRDGIMGRMWYIHSGYYILSQLTSM